MERDEVNPMGYCDSGHTKNVKDWKEVLDYMVVDPSFIPTSADSDDKELRTLTNQWPHYPSDLNSERSITGITPLDELVNEQNPEKYKEFNWGKFHASRNCSDFKKRVVENIQIHHFKASDQPVFRVVRNGNSLCMYCKLLVYQPGAELRDSGRI